MGGAREARVSPREKKKLMSRGGQAVASVACGVRKGELDARRFGRSGERQVASAGNTSLTLRK